MKHRILGLVIAAVAAGSVSACALIPFRGGSQAAVTPPSAPASRYLIGPADVLNIVFWREETLSGDVVVRPDGKISIPLLNDVQAAGYTPEQLRESLVTAASSLVADPKATVIVKQINSMKAFITGNVAQPGTYPLSPDMTALQLIAVAGGLLEYADSGKILIVRNVDGKPQYLRFNYKDIIARDLRQHIALAPGDTVVVP